MEHRKVGTHWNKSELLFTFRVPLRVSRHSVGKKEKIHSQSSMILISNHIIVEWKDLEQDHIIFRGGVEVMG
jgi:hypothetical protein